MPRLTSIVRYLTLSLGLIAAMGISPDAKALEEPGAFRFGVETGLTGLLGDVGVGQRTGTTFGGLIGYRINEPFAINVSYLFANHERLSHRDFGIGLDYYLNDDVREKFPFEISKLFPYLTAGLSFVSNKFEDPDISGNSIAFNVGGGLDYQLTRTIRIGPQLVYQKAIEAKTSFQTAEVKTVQDSYLVMVRAVFSYFETKE